MDTMSEEVTYFKGPGCLLETTIDYNYYTGHTHK